MSAATRPGARLVPSTQEALDRITYVAGETLNVDVVCASLVDARRRLLVSSYGQPALTALLLSHPFRRHVSGSPRPLVIADGRSDPLVARTPVVRDGTVRSCVGVRLGTTEGRPIGTLVALDHRPRRWTTPQLVLLGELAVAIVSEVELEDAASRAPIRDTGRHREPAALELGSA